MDVCHLLPHGRQDDLGSQTCSWLRIRDSLRGSRDELHLSCAITGWFALIGRHELPSGSGLSGLSRLFRSSCPKIEKDNTDPRFRLTAPASSPHPILPSCSESWMCHRLSSRLARHRLLRLLDPSTIDRWCSLRKGGT